MAEYDLDGWKVPDLTDPGELSYHVMRGKTSLRRKQHRQNMARDIDQLEDERRPGDALQERFRAAMRGTASGVAVLATDGPPGGPASPSRRCARCRSSRPR